MKTTQAKQLTKTREAILKRPLKKSVAYLEVYENKTFIQICLRCNHQFRAISKFNKVCDQCKATDTWKNGTY